MIICANLRIILQALQLFFFFPKANHPIGNESESSVTFTIISSTNIMIYIELHITLVLKNQVGPDFSKLSRELNRVVLKIQHQSEVASDCQVPTSYHNCNCLISQITILPFSHRWNCHAAYPISNVTIFTLSYIWNDHIAIFLDRI